MPVAIKDPTCRHYDPAQTNKYLFNSIFKKVREVKSRASEEEAKIKDSERKDKDTRVHWSHLDPP